MNKVSYFLDFHLVASVIIVLTMVAAITVVALDLLFT